MKRGGEARGGEEERRREEERGVTIFIYKDLYIKQHLLTSKGAVILHIGLIYLLFVYTARRPYQPLHVHCSYCDSVLLFGTSIPPFLSLPLSLPLPSPLPSPFPSPPPSLHSPRSSSLLSHVVNYYLGTQQDLNVVEIVRSKGLYVLLSSSNRPTFLLLLLCPLLLCTSPPTLPHFSSLPL